MPIPTIATIRPRRGAANGSTLIEIAGTNFRVPTPPSTVPTVRVTIGGRWAKNVLVYTDGYLVCTTPKGDPFTASVLATASAATDVFTAPGHTLRDGDRLRLSGANLPAPLTLPDAPGALPLYARDVVAVVSFKVTNTPGGAAINLTASGACTILSDGYQALKIENIDDDGVPIPGEVVTETLGFQYVRPDLTNPGQLSWVLRQFLRDMKRLCENVAWTTHSDYDEATGDLLNIARLAKLPAIILSDLRIPEDRKRAIQAKPTELVGETRFRERRAPIVLDVITGVTCVSDNPIEILNMLEAVRAHFKKVTHLEVPRDGTGADLNDVIRYEQHAKFVDVAVNPQQEGTTIHSFSLDVEILGIVSEVDPGAPTETLAELTEDGHHEATTAFGYTLETPVISVSTQVG